MVRITGYVYDRNGRAISHAHVRCGDKSTLTNFDGKFELDLEVGNNVLHVNMKGFKYREVHINIMEEQTIFIHLDRETGFSKIYGYVYDAESGETLKLGIVTLVLPFTNLYVNINENGYYEFNNLASGEYELIVSPLNYIEEKFKVTLSEGEEKKLNFYCRRKVEEPSWG
ncbi:MAG: carboxypeptidase regulatory-like domain-containing protein [Candidatus Methanomethylicia archaeon]